MSRRLFVPVYLFLLSWPVPVEAGGCFVAPAGREVRMPALQVFLSWDADRKEETLTLQPEFESDTDRFGFVIATPAAPETAPVPRDFFRQLADFTRLKQRRFPESRLLPLDDERQPAKGAFDLRGPEHLRLLDEGITAFSAWRTVPAGKLDDLKAWLKENNFVPPPDIEKAGAFTFAQVEAKQLRKDRDGRFRGAVAPFRLTFAAKEPILPLRLAGAGAAERLDLRCWVQAADKMDLPGDLSYEYHWVLLLQHAVAEQKGLLSGKGEDWLQALQVQLPDLVKKSKELGFTFVKNQLPQPNRKGRTVAVLEWAKRLTPTDLLALKGEVPLSERVPDPDEGFTETDLRNPARAEAIRRVIRERLERYRKDRPAGFLVREGVGPDVKGLPALAVTLQQGRFLTRFHKMLTRDEPAEDVVPVPASFGPARDASEYEERLPGSPP